MNLSFLSRNVLWCVEWKVSRRVWRRKSNSIGWKMCDFINFHFSLDLNLYLSHRLRCELFRWISECDVSWQLLEIWDSVWCEWMWGSFDRSKIYETDGMCVFILFFQVCENKQKGSVHERRNMMTVWKIKNFSKLFFVMFVSSYRFVSAASPLASYNNFHQRLQTLLDQLWLVVQTVNAMSTRLAELLKSVLIVC